MTPEELGSLFESFTVSAFRLECLEEYAVTEDAEREAFRRFLNDNFAPSWWTNGREWFTTVRNAAARGATVQRVRMVYGPLSEYQQFQFAWSYPYNEQAGEQIFVMPTGPTDPEPLRYPHDFWLFDDATVVRLIYDDGGRFIGLEAVEDVERYCRIRDLVLAKSTPFRQYQPADYPKRRRTGNVR